MDIAERRPAEADRRRHVRETALHQHDVRGVDGDVRSRADGNTGISPGQCRSVVDAVADHCRFPHRLQGADHFLLAGGKNVGDNLVHPRLAANRFRCPAVIARQHDDAQPHTLKLGNGLATVLLDGIRHRDHPQAPAVPGKKERRFPLLRQCIGFLR